MDYLLQAQDLNQDGLLAPSELLSSSSTVDHHQENNIVLPDPPADKALKQEQTHTKSEDVDAEVNQESEHENETQDPAKEHTQEEKPVHHNQIPEMLLSEEHEPQDDQQEQKNMPVHQEQPEM